jgi:hypothetical protein
MLQEQVPCRVQLECAWSNIEVQARKRFHEGFSRDMTKAISAKTQDLSRLRTGFEDAFGLGQWWLSTSTSRGLPYTPYPLQLSTHSTTQMGKKDLVVTPTPELPGPPHVTSAEELVSALESDIHQGLSEDAAASLLKKYGPNQIKPPAKPNVRPRKSRLLTAFSAGESRTRIY